MAALNLGAYLGGYLFRLYFMTTIAKSRDAAINRSYFCRETLVAAVALTIVPLFIALIGRGQVAQQLRTGFTTFLVGPAVGPALAIGFCYACLYYFGSWIYLSPRENSCCVPLNRCASLLSGIVASYGMTLLLGAAAPSGRQLLATAVVMVALLTLSVPAVTTRSRAAAGVPRLARWMFLFVCSGNTSRSPIAAAICSAEIASRLGLTLDELREAGVQVISAGIKAAAGTPMPQAALQTLAELGIDGASHRSTNVTQAMVREADVVYCMTGLQRSELLLLYPAAEPKIACLDPNGDLDDPHAGGLLAYRELVERVRILVRRRIAEVAVV